jgi:hypothetical protein
VSCGFWHSFWTSNWEGSVMGACFPFEHQYHPISVRLICNVLLFSFCSTLNLSLGLFRLLRPLSFCVALLRWDFLYKTFGDISYMTHIVQTISKDTMYFNRVHFSQTVISLCETQNRNGRVWCCCVRKKNGRTIRWLTCSIEVWFPYVRKGNYKYTLYIVMCLWYYILYMRFSSYR